jgi:hypothetical protein
MSPINSRAKGKRAEQAFINRHLREHWPEAARNIDQCRDDKRDVVAVKGVHFQIKAVEALNIWKALAQAEGEARDLDLPVVAFKRNRSEWYCALPADELIALLRLREAL